MSDVAEAASRAAEELRSWFEDIVRVVDRSLFDASAKGPHRNALVLNVLTRNARRVREERVDGRGELYTPLCLVLVAGCERLELSLGTGHWKAAVDNVISLRGQVEGSRADSATVGLELGTPASHLKEQLDEALRNAGVGGVPSFLDPNGRRIALGLAINWGIRFLCAYALECEKLPITPERRDLGWIQCVLRSLLAVGPPETG